MMESNGVRLLDKEFARFLAKRSRLSGKERDAFQRLVCKLSASHASGNSCLPITATEEDLVTRSGLCGEQEYPLTLFSKNLYLQRFFQYERSLASALLPMASETRPVIDVHRYSERLFPGQGRMDPQRQAAEQALHQSLLIISGGPGTGKTTTVVKILALMQCASDKKLQISLAAPTGKAAMRLQDSVVRAAATLDIAEEDKRALPRDVSTLHRLLGVRRHSPYFHHHRENPLPCDVLVIDEASMVDLPLMAKVVTALRPGSRLILLGDRHQLASVESGTVLGDMMAALPGNSIELTRSYRFDSGIKQFSETINRGEYAAAWDMVVKNEPPHISLLQEDVFAYGGRKFLPFMQAVSRATSEEEYVNLFPLLRSFMILCAVRHGIQGVLNINGGVERYLSEKGYACHAKAWYPGRPVLLTKNEYELDLYNGDMGICLPDPQQPDLLKVWFENGHGGVKGILPGRLENCETVFALTIHKSQGSEADHVLVMLPDKEVALVSRELLYTAVTRARKSVTVATEQAVFEQAVTNRTRRASGLARLLCDGVSG